MVWVLMDVQIHTSRRKQLELAISIAEAARRAGVGRSSIYEAIRRGELLVRKCGRRSLILLDDLRAWLSSLPEAK
jgi:excisionase family DNA binding protein